MLMQSKARPVQVVRRRSRSEATDPTKRASIVRSTDEIRTVRLPDTLTMAVEVTAVGSSLAVELLSEHPPLSAGDEVVVHFRARRLGRRYENDDDPMAELRKDGVGVGSTVVLTGCFLEEDGTVSAFGGTVVSRPEDARKTIVFPDVLASIRHLLTGDSMEIALVVCEEAEPIHGVSKGLSAMLRMLTDNDYNNSNPGFILRGRDPKTGLMSAETCLLSERQRRSGADIEDALRAFLKEKVPGLSKAVRDAKEPWEIVPINLVPSLPEMRPQLENMARRLPFRQQIDGNDLWFAQCVVAMRRGDDGGWYVCHLSPMMDRPMMVGPDHADEIPPYPLSRRSAQQPPEKVSQEPVAAPELAAPVPSVVAAHLSTAEASAETFGACDLDASFLFDDLS